MTGGSRLVPLTRERLAAIELDGWRPGIWPTTGADSGGPERSRVRGWAEGALADWGHCGMVAQSDGVPLGVLVVVPARQVPPVGAFQTTSFGPGAAVVVAAAVDPGRTRQGVGRQLVQAVAADLVGRHCLALEALGRATAGRGGLPEAWLTAVGFRLVRDHPLSPRYRMDLSTTVRWRPGLSSAWSRLRGMVTPPAPPEPARYDVETVPRSWRISRSSADSVR